MLSLFIIAPVHARAGHIRFDDVAQAMVGVQGGQPRVELRLRGMSQSGRTPVVSSAGQQTGTQQQSSNTTQTGTQTTTTTTQSGGATPPLTGVEPAQGGTSGQIQVVDLGEVTGTVCDCTPPIPPPGGGFPLWPLFGLGAVPLFFIGGDEDIDILPTPTPTPPVEPIPEPATILLLGSSLLALGAGARRRRAAQKQLEKGIVIAEEG